MPNPHPKFYQTLRQLQAELGIEAPVEIVDWHLVAHFRAASHRDYVNSLAFEHEIVKRYPGHIANMLMIDAKDTPTEAFVFVSPDVDMEFVTDLLIRMERDGHLDEDAYWARVKPIIQSTWANASTVERIEFVALGNVDDDDAILMADVPPGAHDEIWRQLDD